MKQVPKRDPETATEAVHRIWGDPYEAHKPRHNCPHCRCAGADPQRLTVNQLQTRDLLVELWPLGVDRALVEVGRYLDALKACAFTSGDNAAELGVERPPDCPEWLARPTLQFRSCRLRGEWNGIRAGSDHRPQPRIRPHTKPGCFRHQIDWRA